VFQPAEPAGVPAVRVQPAGQAPVWLFADVPRWWPTGAIPGQRGAARAFLIGEGAIEQVRLPPAEHAEQHVQCTGEAVVEQDRLVLRGRLQLGDLAGFGLADQLRRRTADVQALAARQVCQQLFPGYRVRQANPADLEPPGRPLALEFELQDAGAQAVADDRWLLPLPLPDSRLRESFGDRDERTLPLRLDHDLELQFAVAIDPGPGRRFAALPAPLLLSFGPLDYQLTFSQQRGTVRIERRLRLQPATLPVALYGQWLATLAAIDRAEQQQLVLLRSAEQGR
jgi:hypothetical protein